MILFAAVKAEGEYGKPRASGDDPHERLPGHGARRVNPARAGMILFSPGSPSISCGKPRASGDDPATAPTADPNIR